MINSFILQIGLIISIAALLGILARIIKQPAIISYLLTGIIVGPLFLNLINPSNNSSLFIQTFATIGVALLLFIVGLNLDFRVLKEIGKVASFAGVGEILITGFIGSLISFMLGFAYQEAFYIGIALAFSSTVLVVKILSDKKELDTLHGRLALGILIVEDFVAAIALMVVPLLNGTITYLNIFIKVISLIALIVGIIAVSYLLLYRLLDYFARHQETLFLFGISWALLIAILFDHFSFSFEIGALVAGVSLASSKYTLELSNKLKPLRDFFVVLFFVYFGSQLAGQINASIIGIAILLSLFVVVGKPIIVMAVLKYFGYKKRTNFLAGSSLAQISEFSLIITLLGYNLGHISQNVMSIVILVALITIGVSSYSIHYSHYIFSKIGHLFNMFESNKRASKITKVENYPVILLGYHRIGYRIARELKKLKVPFAVIDNNPKVIISLGKEKINAIYADAGDRNSLHEIGIKKAKLVISTVPDEEVNLAIKDVLHETKSNAVFLATAEQPRSALDLYDFGVDYVIVPHHLGGDYVADMIEKYGINTNNYKLLGKKHYQQLKKEKTSSKYN